MNTLFKNTSLNNLPLSNRIVMAPMTRARTTQPGNIPNDMMATYYAQRASAGLIITEATQISDDSQGYSFTPGIYTDEQITGWRKVTTKVHESGAKIFCQLWHTGRVSHPMFHNNQAPFAPSAIKPTETSVWIVDKNGVGSMVECGTPREMTQGDIEHVINDFAYAAERAIEAGFDGIEIHGGNGYLIDQFMRTNSNHRLDGYGQTRTNRIRFLLEIVDAVINKIGHDNVGVRLAPFITFKDMDCPDIVPTILEAASQLQARNVAYLHLSEADWDDAPIIPHEFREQLRAIFTNTIIVAGSYDIKRAEKILSDDHADLVAFGRPFIANPDFVMRSQHQYKLAKLDPATLFGGNDTGYIDYPPYQVN